MVGKKHKKRILVLVAKYPTSAGYIGVMFVHARNLWYAKSGLNVEVLNLSATRDDHVDGIRVICKKTFKSLPSDHYDILISHQPNIRQHYLFLIQYAKRYKNVFFFHGHEVLRRNEVYSKPFPFVRRNRLCEFAQDLYDSFKLKVWHRYFLKTYKKVYFVFVSNWMKEQFLKWTKLSPVYLEGRSAVIYNAVHPIFETEQWDPDSEKVFDFITIRSGWDESKYAVDIVNKLAANNPDYKFLLVGQGTFFEHYEKAENLTLLKRRLKPEEMIPFLNSSRCALMPTRTDAQGLMMCEMASFGMPLITSDIPVCHEVLDDYNNVYFISNDSPVITFDQYDLVRDVETGKYRKFMRENTVQREIELIARL